MRRALWHRALATLIAVWLPLIVGEPGWLPPCPMHAAGHAMGSMMHHRAPAHASAGDGAMAMHDHAATGPESATGGSHQGPAQSNAQHQCTCIDCCGIGMAAVLQPTQPLVAVVVADLSTTPTVRTAESLPRPAPEYSRPYNTGPPRA